MRREWINDGSHPACAPLACLRRRLVFGCIGGPDGSLSKGIDRASIGPARDLRAPSGEAQVSLTTAYRGRQKAETTSRAPGAVRARCGQCLAPPRRSSGCGAARYPPRAGRSQEGPFMRLRTALRRPDKFGQDAFAARRSRPGESVAFAGQAAAPATLKKAPTHIV